MKKPETAELKLLILLAIAAFATALNLTIALQVTIGLSWWTSARPLHYSWLGWPTYAIETTALSVVGLLGGYGVARSKPPPSIIGLIIFSSVSSIFGLVVYSRMAPITDLRFPGDLRSYYSQLALSVGPEQLAQLMANMGVGAIVRRLFATDDSRLNEE